MIILSDLIRFGQQYPPGSLNDPNYAFAGGTAMQCWLHDPAKDRKHHDIDLFAFKIDTLKSVVDTDFNQVSFFSGELKQDSILADNHTAPNKIQIIRGSYFDAEITPTRKDIRSVLADEVSLL
jgi:hypothetical protein